MRTLTPAEQRVAELVAQGCSNPEVAQALRLSAKTVEWHLSHVYRKLGVHGRGELAAVFGATTPLGRGVAEVEPTDPLPEPRMPRKYGLQRGLGGAGSQEHRNLQQISFEERDRP